MRSCRSSMRLISTSTCRWSRSRGKSLRWEKMTVRKFNRWNPTISLTKESGRSHNKSNQLLTITTKACWNLTTNSDPSRSIVLLKIEAFLNFMAQERRILLPKTSILLYRVMPRLLKKNLEGMFHKRSQINLKFYQARSQELKQLK